MSFAPSLIQDHCRAQDTPEILSSLEINEKVTDLESLLKYSISVLNFLEENQLNSNLYSFKGPEFTFLFQKFEAYYEKISDISMTQLMGAEYLIHSIAGFSATQDISVYIKSLLPKIHDKPEIYELIRLLLKKKGEETFQPFAITYSNFLLFLSPFLRYLRTINLDFLKIYELCQSDILVLAQKHLMELQKLLELESENKPSLAFFDEELLKLKNLIQKDQDNESYYEKLGLWSFIYHLTKRDHTFLHICLTASSYFSIFPIKTTSHHKLTQLNQMGSANYHENTWHSLIKQIIAEFESKENKKDLLKLLHSALLLSNENADFFKQLLENSRPLFLELWEFLWKQKELSNSDQYLEGFLSYIDSVIYVLYGLYETSFSTSPKLVKDSKEFLAFNSSYQQHKINSNCQPLLKNKHYLLQSKILQNYPSWDWGQKVLQNLNFSDTPLIQILELKHAFDSTTDLSLNLRETLNLIRSKASNLTKEDHQNIRLLFQRYIDIITNRTFDINLERLTHFGYFLTRILEIFDHTRLLRKVKVPFISAFIAFLSQKNFESPSWEFYRTICDLEKGQNFEPLLENEYFSNFLCQIEAQASRFNKEPQCFFQTGQLRFLPIAQEIFYKLILTSLEKIKQELDVADTAQKIQDLWRRFTLSTLVWLFSYIQMIRPNKKVVLEKLEKMLSLACPIYLHPCFLTCISQKQKSWMQSKFRNIIQQTKYGKSLILKQYFCHLQNEISQTSIDEKFFLNKLNSDPHPAYVPPTLSTTTAVYVPERLESIPELFRPKESIFLPKSMKTPVYSTIKQICISDLPQFLLKAIIPLAPKVKAEGYQKYADALITGITSFIDFFSVENRHAEIKSELPRIYENFLSEVVKEDVINSNASYLIDKLVVASQKLPDNCKNELKNKILVEDFWWIYVVKRTNHYITTTTSQEISRWYETLQFLTSNKNPKDLNQYGSLQLEKLISSVVYSLFDIVNKTPLEYLVIYQELWLQKTIKCILEIICNYSIFLKNQYNDDDSAAKISDLKALFTKNLEIFIIFETYKDLHLILDHTDHEMATTLTKHCLQAISATDQDFPESQISQLFYIELYTVPLISLIHQQKANSAVLQDEAHFLNIQKKTAIIIEGLSRELPKQQLLKIENSLQNITKLQLHILTYFAMENKDCCSTLFAPTFTLISSIFKLHSMILEDSSDCLIGSATLLEYLAALSQIALFSSPTLASSYLIEKTNLISSFLSVKTETSRATDTFVTILIITLDLYLWNSLPPEISIEIDLKKELLKSYYFNLSRRYPNLTNQRKSLLEHERTNFDSLVSTLIGKFGFEKPSSDPAPVFEFDPCKEIKAAQCPQKIDQVINSLSTNAQSIIRLLTYSLLQNYSDNLAEIAIAPNKPSCEVSGIMQILATFAKKYPAVTLYLVFAKNDYTSIFPDQENYKSITFLDCLFKSKFFYMQAAAFHLLIEPLVIPSGITFLLDTTNQLSDLSHIFLIKLISSLSIQLQKLSSSIFEDSSIILLVMNLVYYLQTIEWFSKNSYSRETKFPEALTTELKLLFHKTLAAFQVLNTTAYLAFENFDDIYSFITLWLKSYYKDQLNQLPSNPDTKTNKIKCDNYLQFLIRSDQIESSSPTIAPLQDLLHTIHRETKFAPQSVHPNYVNSHHQPSPLDIKVWSILSNQRQDLTFNFPYCGMRQEISKKTAYWSDYESQVSKQMQGLADFSGNKQFQHLAPYLTQKTLRLVPAMILYSSLPSISSPIISAPDKDLKTWEKSSQQLFQELSSRLSQQSTESNKIELGWIQSSSKPKNTFIHHSQPKESSSDQKEKYFADYLNQPQYSVLSTQRALLLKLKIITEKVLAARTPNSSLNPKDVANAEINQVPESERPLLLCLIERFSVLQKLYDYPPEFAEIQTEFQCVKAKDPARFPKILISSDYQTPSFFDDQTEFCVDLTSEDAQQESPEFTVKEDQVIEKSITFFIQQIPAFPDEVVESFISIFFINYQGAFCNSQSRLEMMDLLLNSPTFEIKLLDFCFFFLYCGTDINVISAEKTLPCHKIYNLSENLSPLEVYHIASNNILNFLKDIIHKRVYPLYLPRFFFERYSLKKLHPLKIKANFMAKTSGLISVSDLLIGLLQVTEIGTNCHILLREIITTIISTNRNFKIIKSPFGQELSINEPRILSVKSCDIFLDLFDHPSILINCFHLHLDKIIDKMEHQILILAPIIQQIIEARKKSLDIQNLPDFQPLTNLLTAIVVAQAEWLDKVARKNYFDLLSSQQSSLTGIDQLFLKAFEKFFKHVLNQHEILDFIVSLFELAEYLTPAVDVVKLCRLFYNLIALKCEFESVFLTNKKSHESLLNLPVISNVKSTDSTAYESSLDLPELAQTFSNIRRTKAFNFDLLFIHLFKKHSKDLLQDIYQDSKTRTLKKEINYLCKKAPWILPLSDKQTILKFSSPSLTSLLFLIEISFPKVSKNISTRHIFPEGVSA